MKFPIIPLSRQASSRRSLFLGGREAARKKNGFPCQAGKRTALGFLRRAASPKINLSQSLQLLCSLAAGQGITREGAEREAMKTTSQTGLPG